MIERTGRHGWKSSLRCEQQRFLSVNVEQPSAWSRTRAQHTWKQIIIQGPVPGVFKGVCIKSSVWHFDTGCHASGGVYINAMGDFSVWTDWCMYVRMYVCMYVCTYVCMYVCMYVRMYLRILACRCLLVYERLKVSSSCVLLHVQTRSCVHVFLGHVCALRIAAVLCL